jgi:hypothetical protein
MKHKHHVIPRHMGGSDEPSNIIEVTIEEHAELHLALYLEYGLLADWIACNMLAGQMGKEEFMLERCKLGGSVKWTDYRRKRYGELRKGYKHSEETKRKISESHRGKKKHTEESKKKLREFNTGKVISKETRRKLSQNHNGLKPNKGKTWWTNGIESKLLIECPKKWWKGRVINRKR